MELTADNGAAAELLSPENFPSAHLRVVERAFDRERDTFRRTRQVLTLLQRRHPPSGYKMKIAVPGFRASRRSRGAVSPDVAPST